MKEEPERGGGEEVPLQSHNRPRSRSLRVVKDRIHGSDDD